MQPLTPGRGSIRKKLEDIDHTFRISLCGEAQSQSIPFLFDPCSACCFAGKDEEKLAQVGPASLFRKVGPQKRRDLRSGPQAAGEGQPGQKSGRLIETGRGNPALTQPDFRSSQKREQEGVIPPVVAGFGHALVLYFETV